MKSCRRIPVRALLAVAVLFGAPARAPANDLTLRVVADSAERSALLHLPAKFDPRRYYPVVFGFHGGLGNAEGYIANSRLFDKAEAAGFVAVCPEGTPVIGNHRVWNSGSEYVRSSRGADDVGFTRALLNAVMTRVGIDRKRVYATGFSNGGQMDYRLALEASDIIAAIAPMSGATLSEGAEPPRPVPVMHFHGTTDTVYPFDGGLGPHSIGRTPHVPVAAVISQWVRFNHASEAPEILSHEGWQEQMHAGTTPVVLVLVEGLGHQIAGGTDDRLPGQALRDTPDSVELALRFFLDHPMP